MVHVDPTIAAGLSKFTIPLVAKIYPQLIASKLVAVQPMTAPASLIHYLRRQYRNMVKAPPEVFGAILLWFRDMFQHLKIEEQESEYEHIFIHSCNSPLAATRVAVLNIWDGRVDFVHDKFEMSDPEMFVKLHTAVVEYFRPVRSNDNEHTRNTVGI